MGIILIDDRPDERWGATVEADVRAEPAHVSMRVPFAASSVSAVRRDLRTWMKELGTTGDRIEDARVVISELVANSVRHAQPLADGCLIVAWRVDGRGLQISVTDGGAPTEPHTVDAPVSATSGRGMSIVETLVADWWLENTPSRSTVHALLDWPARASAGGVSGRSG
jgi:serine/threonine-protein kinase RsbW